MVKLKRKNNIIFLDLANKMGVKKMNANPLIIANNILNKAFKDNIEITPMKLQKLEYILYKSYLKSTNLRLFSEPFEVWKYGPVIRSVYDEFKEYKTNSIKRFYIYPDNTITYVKESSNPVFQEILDNVWKKYRFIDGIRLSEMTHQSGTAWYKAAIKKERILNDIDIKNEEEFINDTNNG